MIVLQITSITKHAKYLRCMIWYVVLIANNLVVHESFYGANFSELHSSRHNMVDLRHQKYQVTQLYFKWVFLSPQWLGFAIWLGLAVVQFQKQNLFLRKDFYFLTTQAQKTHLIQLGNRRNLFKHDLRKKKVKQENHFFKIDVFKIVQKTKSTYFFKSSYRLLMADHLRPLKFYRGFSFKI